MNRDYFALFGLEPRYCQDTATLKALFLALQQKIHPDNFTQALFAEKQLSVAYAATVNEAYKTLLCPLLRALYLLKLSGVDPQSETNTSMPAEFLMEQMTLREQLAEVSDPLALAEIEQSIEKGWQTCESALMVALDNQEKDLATACLWVRKMQFYARLREEVLLCLC